MTTRTINKSLLRSLIKEKGLEQTAVEANCSASLLQKLISDKFEGTPSIRTIDGLCFATGKTMDELFPTTNQEKSAS